VHIAEMTKRTELMASGGRHCSVAENKKRVVGVSVMQVWYLFF